MDVKLRSVKVGPVPLINHFASRVRMTECVDSYPTPTTSTSRAAERNFEADFALLLNHVVLELATAFNFDLIKPHHDSAPIVDC